MNLYSVLRWLYIQPKHVAGWIKLCLDLIYIFLIHKAVTVAQQLVFSQKTRQSCGQCWNVNKIFYVTSKEHTGSCGTRGEKVGT
jgi:hypothetical protein